MTVRPNNTNQAELENLYRQAGEVEPPAGLDRIVRARADEALSAAPRRQRPWLGGIVTVSVATLAIVLVTLQPLPRSPMPPMPEPSGQENIDVAPRVAEAPQESGVWEPGAPALEETHAEPADRAQSRPATTAPEMRRQYDSSPARSLIDDAAGELESIVVPGARFRTSMMPEVMELPSSELVISEIRRLVEAGELQAAHAMADALAAHNPEHEWPEDIASLIERD